jgi:hypothetical protein
MRHKAYEASHAADVNTIHFAQNNNVNIGFLDQIIQIRINEMNM